MLLCALRRFRLDQYAPPPRRLFSVFNSLPADMRYPGDGETFHEMINGSFPVTYRNEDPEETV